MTGLRNDPISHDRAPSHRKIAMPRAAEIADRIEAGETMAQVAASIGRTTATLRQHLLDHGWDSETARPIAQPPRPVATWGAMFPAFMADAVCGQTDPDAFFPESGANVREAKRLCNLVCEVREECLTWALDNDQRWGVWGGTSPQERKRMKREAS